jgi:hypothetical protein
MATALEQAVHRVTHAENWSGGRCRMSSPKG